MAVKLPQVTPKLTKKSKKIPKFDPESVFAVTESKYKYTRHSYLSISFESLLLWHIINLYECIRLRPARCGVPSVRKP